MKFVRDFSQGFVYPFRAVSFIRQHPAISLYIIIPFQINLVVFALSIFFGFRFFEQVIASAVPASDAWYWLILTYVVWVIAILMTLVLVFFAFTALGNLIAAPFNEILAEKTEAALTGCPTMTGTGFSFVRSLRLILEEGKKISIFILGMATLLLLNLLPLVGSLLYALLAPLWTMYFLAAEYTGYFFSRKNIPFREQRRFLRSHLFLAAGFATALLLILAIPFIQFFSIPIGVVGATLLCGEADNGILLRNRK